MRIALMQRKSAHVCKHSVAHTLRTLLPVQRLACCILLSVVSLTNVAARGQSGDSPTSPLNQPAPQESGTSTDLYVMIGSDFDRPGLLPRASYNIGIGHTFGFLKKDPIGDELTFSYTYENSGSHGFFHTDFGEHTEMLGVMKNFSLPRTKVVTGYTWVQGGVTSYTGKSQIQNRFCSGPSLGLVVHLSYHSSIWLQESYTKVVTVPWYTTSSLGYTYSW